MTPQGLSNWFAGVRDEGIEGAGLARHDSEWLSTLVTT